MLLLIHLFILAINAQGQWVPYNLSSLLPSNVSQINNANGSITKVVAIDQGIIPNYFTYIYLGLLAIYFIIFASGRSRKAFIGVAFLGLMTAIIMVGAALLPLIFVGISWAIWMVITLLVLIVGE